MDFSLDKGLGYKIDIISRLYRDYPNECVISEPDYGCNLLESPGLYRDLECPESLKMMEDSGVLIKSIQELKTKGIIFCRRVNHMGWSAKLTPFGYNCLYQLCYEENLPTDNVTLNKFKKIIECYF
ncbi:hypothetical protein [Klebsiella aerogenes]|uniref:hypothetical protein n=1 Tax=Klebsiella aerogenes TaxID=548 RepID=UPI0021CF1986|nr:hypothetical protein [Klebsiella aerogenes]MCU6317011.1 hypothetical protein [Klebsiella aerogenes]